MTAAEATAAAQLLHSFRQLSASPAWSDYIAPRIRDAHEHHLLGVTDRGAAPEERSQHLEAYHLARDLEAMVPERIAALEKQLADWVKSQDLVDSRLMDMLT